LGDELQKERERKTKKRRREWETEERGRVAAGRRPRTTPALTRANLTAEERAAVERRLRPYGLLDYLYRLRMRAQYEDATMFTDGPSDTSESVAVYKSLRRITSATLLLHEMWMAQLMGTDPLERLVEDWLAASDVAANPLEARQHLFL
jgi:hypothetical protein